jgi:hypothetical protein
VAELISPAARGKLTASWTSSSIFVEAALASCVEVAVGDFERTGAGVGDKPKGDGELVRLVDVTGTTGRNAAPYDVRNCGRVCKGDSGSVRAIESPWEEADERTVVYEL